MPLADTARRTVPKNQRWSFRTGPPKEPSNCLTYAVVGVPPALGLQVMNSVQFATLLSFHPNGWYWYAPEPLNRLPPLFVITLITMPTPIGEDASTPPVLTCVSS